MTNPVVLPMDIRTCTGHGGNVHCKVSHRRGRSVHAIPGYTPGTPRLVLPEYHFATEDEARQVITDAELAAPIVTCDDDLFRFRRLNMPHFLPVGWVDPTRR